MKKLWIRAETKPYERRTPLVPRHAELIISAGYSIKIESSSLRAYTDREYELAGCDIVEPHTWHTAPLDHYILGLKELDQSHDPILHNHLYFAHVYKEQTGSEQLLSRFTTGGGTLYDLEYLVDAAQSQLITSRLGYWAGYCGAALTLIAWAKRQQTKTVTLPSYYHNKSILLEFIKTTCSRLVDTTSIPSIIIIGSRGNAGSGVRALLDQLSWPYQVWGRQETRDANQLKQLLDVDIVFNCALITEPTPPFITQDAIQRNRRLSLISDITCDAGSPLNALPIYEQATRFDKPMIRIANSPIPLDLIALDHLSTILPKESSQDCSSQLLPFLLQLLTLGPNHAGSPWQRSKQTFDEVCKRYEL